MDEVLLIHDWQAMPHVVMNLLCCRRSCATTAVDDLHGVRGELLQIVWLRTFCPWGPSWGRCQLVRGSWSTMNQAGWLSFVLC